MIAIVGLVAAAIFLHSGGQAGISLALAIISPFILLREFARRHGLANMNMTQAFIVDAIAAFVGMLALGLFYYWGWLTATSAMLSIGAGAGLGGAYWLFRNRSQLAFHRESLRLTFWQSWGLGKWLLTSQLAMQICHSLAFTVAYKCCGDRRLCRRLECRCAKQSLSLWVFQSADAKNCPYTEGYGVA
jgi:hypothetical protein